MNLVNSNQSIIYDIIQTLEAQGFIVIVTFRCRYYDGVDRVGDLGWTIYFTRLGEKPTNFLELEGDDYQNRKAILAQGILVDPYETWKIQRIEAGELPDAADQYYWPDGVMVTPTVSLDVLLTNPTGVIAQIEKDHATLEHVTPAEYGWYNETIANAIVNDPEAIIVYSTKDEDPCGPYDHMYLFAS